MTMKPVVQTIKIPGLAINARIWGDDKGLPVLAMHGWLDNAATFDLLAPLLPELHLVSIDLPGHGFSDHLPLCSSYHFVDIALQMFHVADALGWPRFSIMGHSLGGVVGEFMAAIAPDRIQKLVLIDVYGSLSNQTDDLLTQIQKHLRASQKMPSHSIYANYDDAALVRAKVNTAREIPVQAARVLAEGGMRQTASGYEWTFDTRLLLPMPVMPTREQANIIVNHVKADCALIVGSRGILHDPEWNGWKTSAPANFQAYELEGGHHLHLENPRPVAAVIHDFFQRPV